MSTIDVSSETRLPGSRGDGSALVPTNAGLDLVPSPSWFGGYTPRPEIIDAAPGPVSLWHSFRRRWLISSVLGLLLGSLLSALVYFLVPVRYESYALLRIAETASSASQISGPATTFDTFKRSQQQLLKSPPVLDAVLRNKNFSKLSVVTHQSPDDLGSWLEKNLTVDFPGNGEMMRISFRAEKPADAKAIVDEVVEEYMVNVVNKDKQDAARQLDQLDRQVNLKRDELKNAINDVERLKSTLYSGGDVGAEYAKQKYAAEVSHKTNQYYLFQGQLTEVQAQIKALQTRISAKSGTGKNTIPELTIRDKINLDPEIVRLRNKIDEIGDMIAKYQGAQNPLSKRGNPKLEGLVRQRESLSQNLEERESELAPLVLDQLRNGNGVDHSAEELAVYQQREGDLKEKLTQAKTDMDEIYAKAKNLDKNSSAIKEKENVVAAVEHALKILSDDLEMTRAVQSINEAALQRVHKLTETATMPKHSDALVKYLTMVFSGLLGVAACVLGVAVLEFQNRRLNNPTDVSEGLNIPVMGYLPRLSGKVYRKMQTEKGAELRGQLFDCIDGIRSALLYDVKSESCKVILVTSADCQEGKTTVACQLAASLARCGRKTLLIDGDLRRPSAHRVFDVPESPGLAEIFRNQTDRTTAVVATEQPNLWILPAGYADQSCLQILGAGGITKLLEAFQMEYDYVIVDSGAVLQVADPLIIGQAVDAAVISVQRDVSRIPQVYEAYERLRSVGITVLGAVVNGVARQVRTVSTGVTTAVIDPNLEEAEVSSPD
jgi:capsular exopolysaccharide synthesis family protein